jgi:hypothetical protein
MLARTRDDVDQLNVPATTEAGGLLVDDLTGRDGNHAYLAPPVVDDHGHETTGDTGARQMLEAAVAASGADATMGRLTLPPAQTRAGRNQGQRAVVGVAEPRRRMSRSGVFCRIVHGRVTDGTQRA